MGIANGDHLKNYRMEVYTLGQFTVRRGDVLLSEESKKSQKVWDLFKYIITNYQKSILPETIQETLWPGEDYDQTNQAFRTLVYRLRQLLKKGLPEDKDFHPIAFAHGCYSWNTSVDYWLDIEELEKLHVAAKAAKNTDSNKAIDYYREIAKLYRGNYLSESLYTEWTIPARNYYRRIYLQDMIDLIVLLTEAKRYDEVIDCCEKVIQIEPLEEEFHLQLIGALIKVGRINDARLNYEYITSALYKEYGVKPSAEMRKLYTQMKADNGNVVEIDLHDMQERLVTAQGPDEPFFCEKNMFKSIYALERRRSERSGQSVCVILFTVKSYAGAEHEKPLMESLKRVIDQSLRKGDVYSFWNDSQIAAILPGINLEQTYKVVERIEKAFRQQHDGERAAIQSRVQPLLPSQEYLSI